MINILSVFLLSILLVGCGKAPAAPVPPTSSCGDAVINTYTASWDKVTDTDLSGYDVYYKKYDVDIPLNKSNGIKFNTSNESFLIDPISLNLVACDIIEFGVVALGTTKSNSPLSKTIILTVD